MNDGYYIVTKLISGELVMSELVGEDEDFMVLENPMIVRTIPNIEKGKDVVIASPLCVFAHPDDTEYVIKKKNTIYIKKLQDSFVTQYLNLVEDFSEKIDTKSETLNWDKEDDAAFDTVKQKIDILYNLINSDKEEESDKEPKMVFTGNNTLN